MGPPRVKPSGAPGQRSSPQPLERSRAEEESWWEGRCWSKQRCLPAAPCPSPSPGGSWRPGRSSWTRGVAFAHASPLAQACPAEGLMRGLGKPCRVLDSRPAGAQGFACHRHQSKHGAFSPPPKQTGSARAPQPLQHLQTQAGSSQDRRCSP